MEKIGMGALESKKDKRTIKYSDLAFEGAKEVPAIKGGYSYEEKDIEHQHKVGICTAISLIQLMEKKTGKKYSPEFQYICQKRYYDKNITEGSSILSALKVAKNIGFLPLEYWIYTDEMDRMLDYPTYFNKINISDIELGRLKTFCENKIAGYASVDVSDYYKMADAVNESEAGILCRYGCGSTWWIPSWAEKDISPLRKPIPYTSGHAIIMSNYNYSEVLKQTLANTWGTLWCRKGCADIIHSMYAPTEAWTILKQNPMFKFTKTLRFGMRDNEVKELQKRLQVIQTGYFGILTRNAVKKYQNNNGLVADGIVGHFTRDMLNN